MPRPSGRRFPDGDLQPCRRDMRRAPCGNSTFAPTLASPMTSPAAFRFDNSFASARRSRSTGLPNDVPAPARRAAVPQSSAGGPLSLESCVARRVPLAARSPRTRCPRQCGEPLGANGSYGTSSAASRSPGSASAARSSSARCHRRSGLRRTRHGLQGVAGHARRSARGDDAIGCRRTRGCAAADRRGDCTRQQSGPPAPSRSWRWASRSSASRRGPAPCVHARGGQPHPQWGGSFDPFSSPAATSSRSQARPTYTIARHAWLANSPQPLLALLRPRARWDARRPWSRHG